MKADNTTKPSAGWELWWDAESDHYMGTTGAVVEGYLRVTGQASHEAEYLKREKAGQNV